MSARACGYIVDGYHESVGREHRGVLFLGGRHVTVYNTRRQALAALERTLIYARRHGYRWLRSDYRIKRAVAR